ncbi:hypothetical protein BKP45_15525 [Anaerobacillus alkalidiazotrophicus]|uniref:Uncharacterized protein n=1 Tax=Anaerobacillus alkalidiazotrophicus TaxID=472963 RepID=A0A1S2M210_9BACI|nr:hypothetical protein [Anaerobacillus alkalidiazotrophicus]OIJ18779.1 hypothetical protein BKP45_15525 [Anaerobacillus alkalidiazotrophicus]
MSGVSDVNRGSGREAGIFKKGSTATKVSSDLFFTQMKWAIWFVGIVFVVYLVVPRFVTDVASLHLHFLAFIFQPTKIFMLVIGILSCFAFLGYFVGNGITRKDYFIGSAVAAIGVALCIMALASALQGVLHFVGIFTAYVPNTGHGDILGVESAWLVPFVVYSLSVVAYYVAGWLISIGFYRYGGFGGAITIISAIIYVGMTDMSWEGERSFHLFGFIRFSSPELPLPLALVTTVVLLVIGLWVLRRLTKRVPIKID